MAGDDETVHLDETNPGDRLARDGNTQQSASATGPSVRLVSPFTATLTLNLAAQALYQQREIAQLDAECPSLGARIGEDGRFEVLGKLGTGGMGIVVGAMDTKLGRQIAIKFLTHGGADVRTLGLIRQEAMATAKLNHENIVQIFDLGGWNGRPFLVMEYLEGDSLDELVARERPSPRRVIEILLDVARGLDHAHRRGIIHRDLKPSNVFIRKDGRAKILDFGIALIDQLHSELNAKDRAIVGTPAYMAPERWTDGSQDERVDIWAAGVIFHELLTGRNPYHAADLFSVYRLISLDPPELDARGLGVPAEAAQIVKRALARDPNARFQTAAELADALVGLEKLMDHAPTRRRRSGGPERRAYTFLACTFGELARLSDETDLDELFDALVTWNHVCAREVERFEGTVLSSAGGKLLACFGHPVPHEDDAQRAARAASQIVADLEQQSRRVEAGGGSPLSAQIGIHTGLVIVQEMPLAGQPRIPMILGDAPTIAGWLAERAAPGTIAVSGSTEQLVRGLFATAGLGREAPTPASRPVEIHRLLDELTRSSRFERSFIQGLTQLVGRDAEVQRVLDLWDRAKRGSGQLVLISGEAGIGKSRLVQVLKDCVAQEGATRMLCQSWPYLSSSAFYPLVELLSRSMRLHREESEAERLLKLEQLLDGLGLSLPESVPFLASLLAIPLPGRYALPALTPVLQKERTMALLEAIFLKLTQGQPLLFVAEDVHWLDPSSLEVFTRLGEKVGRSRILLVLTGRPEFRAPWPERPHIHHLELERMSVRAASSLVEAAAHGEALPDEIVERLVARTDGVPLFIEELTRVVVEAWQRGERDVDALLPQSIPVTLQDLLAARLDRLGEDAKEIAQIGAVLGKSFAYAMLAACARRDEADLQQNVLRLIEAGVFQPRGEPPDFRLEFRHALIQEAAYQSQPKTKRQTWHRRIARLFVERFPEIVEGQPELVAHHHLEAGSTDKAIASFQVAGRRATMHANNVEAIAHLTRALEAARTLPEGKERMLLELELNVNLGAPLIQTKGYTAQEVKRAYESASLLCKRVGDTPQVFPTAFGLWAYYLMTAEVRTAIEHGEQTIHLAEAAHDAGLLVIACRCLGSALFYAGAFAPSEEHLLRGLAAYVPEKHAASAGLYIVDSGVSCLCHLALVQWLLGRADEARATAEEAIVRAQGSGHLFTQAFALSHVASLGQFLRDPAYATRAADAAIKLGQEHGFPQPMAWSSMVRAWALAERGAAPEGLAVLQQVIGRWKKMGARLLLDYWNALLAEVSQRAELWQEAEAPLDDAIALEQATGQLFWSAELHRLRGELRLRGAAREEAESAAEADFRRAIEIARGQRALALELRATLSLARLLERRGSRQEGARLLVKIRRQLTQGLDTADLREATAFLRDGDE